MTVLNFKYMKILKFAFLTMLFSFSVAQAASLKTQVISSNLGSLPKNAVRVPFLTVNLQAQDGDVTLNNLVIERTGLSSNDDFGRIWAETSNYRRTNSRQFNNDSLVTLEFRNGLKLRDGETTRVTVYANLEFDGGGRSARFNLKSIDHNGDTTAPVTNQFRSNTPPSNAEVQTKSRARYDRTKFKISCKNQRCQLVPRN